MKPTTRGPLAASAETKAALTVGAGRLSCGHCRIIRALDKRWANVVTCVANGLVIRSNVSCPSGRRYHALCESQLAALPNAPLSSFVEQVN